MGIFTSIYNKISYKFSQYFDDPDANAHAEEQAAQKQQDAEAKQRADAEAKKAKQDADNSAKSQEDAKSLNDRSSFSSSRAAGKISYGVWNILFSLIMFVLMIAGGYIAANEAIGYNAPFKILSFIYGALCFWFVIPRVLIKEYWYKIKPQYFTLLPLSTYKPASGIERFFLGPFCYEEDARVHAAKEAVELLYKNGYLKSIGQAVVVAGTAIAAGTAAGTAIAYQGPPQGYQGPPQGYQGPPQGYQGPPQGYQGPPQGYQGPPQGYQGQPPPPLSPEESGKNQKIQEINDKITNLQGRIDYISNRSHIDQDRQYNPIGSSDEELQKEIREKTGEIHALREQLKVLTSSTQAQPSGTGV